MIRLLSAALLAAVLASCATGETRIDERIAELRQFAIDDVSRAQLKAERADDPAAANCWSTILVHLNAEAGQPPIEVGRFGPATAFQSARNLRRGVDRGIPEDVHIACAPLALDAQRTVNRLLLGAAGAGAASLAGPLVAPLATPAGLLR